MMLEKRLQKDLLFAGAQVCGEPDAEDGDVDEGDEDDGTPADPGEETAVHGDDGHAVDDDLKDELDLQDPHEQDEEEGWKSGPGQRAAAREAVRRAHTWVEALLLGTARTGRRWRSWQSVRSIPSTRTSSG